MSNQEFTNQTQFIDQSSFKQEPDEAFVPEVPVETQDENSLVQKKQKKLILFGVGGLVSLLILIIVFTLLRRQSPTAAQDEPTLETQLTPVMVGPFAQRLKELQNELEIADPQKLDLPFPPIDEDITLEKMN